MNTQDQARKNTFVMFTAFAIIFAFFPQLAHAADAGDMFAAGKATIQSSVGTGSTVNYLVIMTAAIAGVLVGILQKNWVLGIVTFFGANIFWSVAMGITSAI